MIQAFVLTCIVEFMQSKAFLCLCGWFKVVKNIVKPVLLLLNKSIYYTSCYTFGMQVSLHKNLSDN